MSSMADEGVKATTPITPIQTANLGDAEAIRSFMRHVIVAAIANDGTFQQDAITNVNKNVDIWCNEPDRCVHLKAVDGPEIVGVVLVKDFWNLCSLFVEPDWHGRGIGRKLVEAAVEQCKGKSPKGALLVNAAAGAIPFYERLGFAPRRSAQIMAAGIVAMQREL